MLCLLLKIVIKKESFLCKYPLLDFKQESEIPVLMGMNSGEDGIFASCE